MNEQDRTYRAIRWGNRPSEQRDMQLPRGTKGTPVAELVAISYLSVKAGKAEVFRHAFDRIAGRGPYLLEVEKRGKFSFPPSAGETVSLGHIIDLEATDPQTGESTVILTPFYFVCTTADALTPKGGPVLLACTYGPDFAIESRGNRPFIREHGIIG